jgi:hypothetical protein
VLVGLGGVSVSVDDAGSGIGCGTETGGFCFLVELFFLA